MTTPTGFYWWHKINAQAMISFLVDCVIFFTGFTDLRIYISTAPNFFSCVFLHTFRICSTSSPSFKTTSLGPPAPSAAAGSSLCFLFLCPSLMCFCTARSWFLQGSWKVGSQCTTWTQHLLGAEKQEKEESQAGYKPLPRPVSRTHQQAGTTWEILAFLPPPSPTQFNISALGLSVLPFGGPL